VLNIVRNCFILGIMGLAKHNRVQLILVPGHEGIAGKETADQLAKIGGLSPLTS
jgi:ribonuclease HI